MTKRTPSDHCAEALFPKVTMDKEVALLGMAVKTGSVDHLTPLTKNCEETMYLGYHKKLTEIRVIAVHLIDRLSSLYL